MTSPAVLRAALHRLLLAAQRWLSTLPAPMRQALRRIAPVSVRPTAYVEGWDAPLVANGAGGLASLPRHDVPSAADRQRSAQPRRGGGSRVAIVTDALDVGGLAVFVAFLARGLDARGHEIHVLVTTDAGDGDGDIARTLRADGFDVGVLTPSDLPAALDRLRPDVVSVHGAPDRAVSALRDRGCPAVETLHGMHTIYTASPSSLARRAAALSAVVAISEQGREEYLAAVPDLPAERIVVIPNGIRSARRPPVERELVRGALGLGDEFVFVSLSRHCLQKNTYGLVAAFGDVAARVPDAHLVVAGAVEDPTYLAQVRRLVDDLPCRDRVHLRDNLDRPELLLAASDCFVLDSFFEGWALAPMEAMTAGLPVVAADVAGAREQLRAPTPCGRLVPNPLGPSRSLDWSRMSSARFAIQENRAALVDAMVEIAEDRESWAARRERISREAVARFDADVCLDRHAAVLEAAARGRSMFADVEPTG